MNRNLETDKYIEEKFGKPKYERTIYDPEDRVFITPFKVRLYRIDTFDTYPDKYQALILMKKTK